MSNAEGLKDDPDALKGILGDAMARLRPAPGYLEGFQATALAIKANEAILAGKRIELQQDLFELS
jgi:hypothetical protein